MLLLLEVDEYDEDEDLEELLDDECDDDELDEL
jgi:hypothetical protein